jgi:hypothetical protein
MDEVELVVRTVMMWMVITTMVPIPVLAKGGERERGRETGLLFLTKSKYQHLILSCG